MPEEQEVQKPLPAREHFTRLEQRMSDPNELFDHVIIIGLQKGETGYAPSVYSELDTEALKAFLQWMGETAHSMQIDPASIKTEH